MADENKESAKVFVKTTEGWVEGTVYVKTTEGWVEGSVLPKTTEGWSAYKEK